MLESKCAKAIFCLEQDCEAAGKDAAVIFTWPPELVRSLFPMRFLNSVVATRNLLDASLRFGSLRRFVLVSSFAVYSNCEKPNGRILDESCPVEEHPELRGEAYCFAKVRQEQLVTEYGKNTGIPYVLVRPGSVYGATKVILPDESASVHSDRSYISVAPTPYPSRTLTTARRRLCWLVW